MSNSYETIPTSLSSAGANGEDRKSQKKAIFVALGVTVVGLFVFLGKNESSEDIATLVPSASVADVLPAAPVLNASVADVLPAASDEKYWPPMLQTMGGGGSFPTTTAEASTKGWVKTDEACNPLLGEAWLLGGELSINSSATMYFTPQVGGVPGFVSGIEVDYYGFMQENLIGTYFSEEKTSSDGTYHSLAVALRSDDICDTENPATPGNAEYIAISPFMANQILPTHQDSPELQSDYKEGACLQTMGYHYFQDVVGGAELTYEADNLVPVVPMYDSVDGTLNGIFFLAINYKQTIGTGKHDGNFWDISSGLSQANTFLDGTNVFCANFCGGCQFTGTEDGLFTTMHWMFKDTKRGGLDFEKCGGAPAACKNGFNGMIEYHYPM